MMLVCVAMLCMAGMLRADSLDLNEMDFDDFDEGGLFDSSLPAADESTLATPAPESVSDPLLRGNPTAPVLADASHQPSVPGVVMLEAVPQVDLPADLTVWEALTYIFSPEFPLRLNYLELMPTNEIARIQSLPCTFATEAPMDWRIVMREILTPHGLDMMEDEDAGIVRLGSVEAVHARYLLQEQERLMRNRTRIEVNFSEGVAIYHALQLVRNLARVNMNFDYMAPADRGVQLPMDSDRGEDAPEGPPPKLTTYATPENAPVEWRIVMREILGPHGYDFVEASGVVRPMTRDAVERWRREQVDARPMITRIVRVFHMDPAQLIERVRAMGIIQHSAGFIQLAHGWDSRGKGVGVARHAAPPTIMIRDIEENIENILAQIKKLDVGGRQIMIEARILDIGTGASRDLGIFFNEFGGSMSIGTGYSSSGSSGRDRSREDMSESRYERDRVSDRDLVRPENDDARNSSFISTSDSTGQMRLASSANSWGMAYDVLLNPFQMSAVWSMLQSSDDVRVVSQPLLVLSDHAESFIRIETEEPYVELETQFQQESGAMIQGYQWQTLNIGVELRVVPEITSDGQHVRLSVLPRISANAGFVTAPDGSQRPRLDVRELDTRVTVRSGHTLLMGGLISSSGENTEQKIPFLGDIPLLGVFFRREVRDNSQRNLVMLITPTILDDRAPDTGYEVDAVPHFEVMREDSRTTMREGASADRMRAIRERMERERAVLLADAEGEPALALDAAALQQVEAIEKEMAAADLDELDVGAVSVTPDDSDALDEELRTMSAIGSSPAFPPPQSSRESTPVLPSSPPELPVPEDRPAPPTSLRETETEWRLSPTQLRQELILERRRRHERRIQGE